MGFELEKLEYVKRKTYEEYVKKNEKLKRNIEELKSKKEKFKNGNNI